MRKIALALCTVSLVATAAAPAPARTPRSKIVEVPYRTPVLGAATQGNQAYYYDCLSGIGCGIVPVPKGYRSAVIDIVDTTGQPVHAEVYVMPGGTHYLTLCGSTGEKVPVSPGTELLVHIIAGTCADGTTVSSPTTGTIATTFDRVR